MENAFRFSSGARGIKDEKRVLAIEAFGFMFRGDLGGFIMPPEVASTFHFDRTDLGAKTLVHDDGFDGFVFF